MDATEALKKLAAEWKPKAVVKKNDGPDLSKWERLQKKAALGVMPEKQTLSMKKLGGMKKQADAELFGQVNRTAADAGSTGADMTMATLPPPPPPTPSMADFPEYGMMNNIPEPAAGSTTIKSPQEYLDDVDKFIGVQTSNV